jgi:hypothetical protein
VTEGWRVTGSGWTFDDPELATVQRKAREVFPEAAFIFYFSGPFETRPRKKRRKP